MYIVKNTSRFATAMKMRKAGKSYSKIHEELGISKGTLHYWFSKTDWSQAIHNKLLKEHKIISRKRIIAMNKGKVQQRIERHDSYRNEAAREFKHLKHNDLFRTGIALYWGEGEKAGRNGRVSVINSDSNMLRVVLKFYIAILHIPVARVRAGLFIYQDLNAEDMLNYWSKQLGIPKTQFIKTQLLPSRSVLTKRKALYGMCSVYFSDVRMHVKILEWIRLLGKDTRV